MAENCSISEPWACWISEAFARENEVLTRALQISISDSSSSGGAGGGPSTPLSSSAATSPFLSATPLSSSFGDLPANQGSGGGRNPISLSPAATGRVGKRKSRASKRAATTYINADAAHFREMVQQVTGVRLGPETGLAEPVLRPEPRRPAAKTVVPQSCLPTLDTSAFLLDRAGAGVDLATAGPVGGHGSLGPTAGEAPVFDSDPYLSFPFPTLESWGVM